MSTEPDRHVEPHRGQMILILGILSLFVANLILGPIAWIMGSNDLKKMRAGQMDRSGESNTNTGRICGMIGTLLGAVGICCLVGVFGLGLGGFFLAASDKEQNIQIDVQPTPKNFKPGEFPFEKQ